MPAQKGAGEHIGKTMLPRWYLKSGRSAGMRPFSVSAICAIGLFQMAGLNIAGLW